MRQHIVHRQPITLWQMVFDRLIVNELKGRIQRQSLDARHPRAVFANEFIGMETFVTGTFERNHLMLLEGLANALRDLRHDLTVLDVGANIGVHSRFLSPSVSCVHAFEPNPEVLPLLEINTADLNNLTIHAIALSDRAGSAALSSNRTWNKGTASLEETGDGDTTEVQTATLDSWVTPEMSVDIVKLDVEGHEISVLTGASETLSRCRPIVAFEQRSADFSDADSETPSISFLRAMDYEMYSPTFSSQSANRSLARIKNLARLAMSRERAWRLEPLSRVPRGLYPMLVAVPREVAVDLPLG